MKTDFLFHKTSINDLMVIEPLYAPDNRGFFSKYYEKETFRQHGIVLDTHECYESKSHKGVLRGLHFQKQHWQNKLVRCLVGELFDVAVDLRSGSSTFGKWEGVYLSDENRKMFYIPKGFAHGFLSLSDESILSYLCGDRYDPASDSGIRFDDPDINVIWPIDKVENKLITSERDRKFPYLRDINLEKIRI